MRDVNETIYRITVEDIFLAAENFGIEEEKLTPEVVDKVAYKIEAMDFYDMAEKISMFIEEAIEEIK